MLAQQILESGETKNQYTSLDFHNLVPFLFFHVYIPILPCQY